MYIKPGIRLQEDLMAWVVEGCARKLNAVLDSCLLGVAEQVNLMAI